MYTHIHVYIRHRALSTKWSVSNAFKDPLTPGGAGPKGLLGARTQITCALACDCFLIIFLMIFRCPIFSDFGPNLVPTWLPTWSPNPPKSFPRGFQIPSQLASCFEYPFLSILGASWVDFWWVLGAKLGAKFTKKSIIWPLVGKLAEITKNIKFADSCTL